MNTVGMRSLGACDELFDCQIALCGWSRADGMGFITGAHMECVPIGVRIDRNAAQAQPPRGSGNTARNLTAIGDQDGFEHEGPRYVGRDTSARAASPLGPVDVSGVPADCRRQPCRRPRAPRVAGATT